MDEFFQKLREIQKKERNLSGLAPVGENFYQNISKYFNVLMRKIDNNPFSFESYLLRDAQRITAEICERREHKISNSAVMSVQRTYQLFKESESDSPPTPKIPRNSTPEEEELFNAIVDSLISYREKMSGSIRFQSSHSKDESSAISDDRVENNGEGDDLKEVAGAGSELDTSGAVDKVDTSDAGSEVDTSRDKNKGFTAEEEAAIEDDIYKQFGKEPFPGDKLKKESVDSNSPTEKSENSQAAQPESEDVQTDVLLVLEELPSIMGVDKKVYGPLLPQDIVTIPEPNARILVKNQKGKSIQKYK